MDVRRPPPALISGAHGPQRQATRPFPPPPDSAGQAVLGDVRRPEPGIRPDGLKVSGREPLGPGLP